MGQVGKEDTSNSTEKETGEMNYEESGEDHREAEDIYQFYHPEECVSKTQGLSNDEIDKEVTNQLDDQ